MSPITQPSINAIDAILEQLIYPFTELSQDANPERCNDAADAASTAVIYSAEFRRVCQRDGRFAEDLHNNLDNCDSAVNRLAMHECFGLGFDFAMALTARIAVDPLGSHDITRIVAEARERYAKCVEQQRDAYRRQLDRDEAKSAA